MDTIQILTAHLDPALRRIPGPREILDRAPTLRCADGFQLSVQAGRHNYCTPRDNTGPWSDVEVGAPSSQVADLEPFADAPGPWAAVYAYVPLHVVAAIIDQHGGVASPPAVAA
ncbi:hypothetical protein [Jannaschia sp. M317]|uniref:hypothetical protein n=1 Tax=Jannaschia sp. M317 TaxID=2867011 RepID=UPI0021A951A2|nr:hypothetical protein [Jannaschia sp. M317]UWQ16131.1 hypothetical protein K3551_09270 [Jannaschia sp. M317]